MSDITSRTSLNFKRQLYLERRMSLSFVPVLVPDIWEESRIRIVTPFGVRCCWRELLGIGME